MQQRIAAQILDDNTKQFLQNNKGILPDKIKDNNYLYAWKQQLNKTCEDHTQPHINEEITRQSKGSSSTNIENQQYKGSL